MPLVVLFLVSCARQNDDKATYFPDAFSYSKTVKELNEVVSVTDDVKQKAISHLVLIKFKIAKAEYYERTAPGKSLAQKMRMQLSRLLFRERSGFKPYRLEPSY